MTNILALHQKYDHLGDVGRMIADPLEMFSNEDQFDGARNRARIFQHVGEELSENLFVKIIDDVVVGNDFFRKIRIRIHKCVETLLENFLRRFGHDRQVDQAFQFRLLDQFP